MATVDQPAGLMDIASSLSQDDIPFKLRCAICNNLALNAFRLPCCDQAICESCQESLPETCPVCTHTPISSDLCKPNKALRTTLKAFLRTEEKKREKERQSATPAVTNGTTPADDAVAPSQGAPAVSNTPDVATKTEPVDTPSVADIPAEPSVVDSQPNGTHAGEGPETSQEIPANGPPQADNDGSMPTDESANPTDPTDQVAPTTEGDDMEETPIAQSTEQDDPPEPPMGSMPPNGMGMGMAPGMFPNMGWNVNADFNNPMSQFMGNGMFNFQNPMAMSGMAMNPMAANQGMFGGYGVNMNGMNNGMNMGMNYDAGQGMYGGWDGGGAQNNMWNGGQDKFNPNAFANGMGPQYGPSSSGFGGYNANGLPQQPQQDFSQTGGYYGPGRGNFRGRGRGFGYMSGPGAGRGRGFPGNPADYPNAHSPAFPHNPPAAGAPTDIASATHDEAGPDEQTASTAAEAVNGDASAQPSEDTAATDSDNAPGERMEGPGATDGQIESEDPSQLRGIPTIDSLDQDNAATQGMMMPTGPMGMMGPMGSGYGRGGNFMRGGPYGGGRGPYMQGPNMHAMPRGPGVEGAPAAPRAMRQGLPNTSVLRQRNFQGPGSTRSSVPSVRPSEPPQSATNSTQPQEDQPLRSKSGSRSRAASASRPRSRTRSPAPSQSDSRRAYRQRSPSVADGRSKPFPEHPERRSDRPRRPRRREDKYDDIPAPEDDRRTRSPSVESRRSSRRRDRERDRDRDRERDRRSGRRSHRSHRHRSASRNGESDRLADIPEENGRSRTPAVGESGDTASRTGRSTKDGPGRRDDERERDRDTRRRDRHRDKDRERDRDRDRDRERDRDRDRERDRDRYRERERGDRDRERDRKRSRRDRSQSPPMDSDYSSRRRNKRTRDDAHDEPRSRDKPASDEPEKDPHTLEREARNRERMQKEQQRREAALQGDSKSSRRRDSRVLGGGRRMNYKYEDEENDSARAARVEKEREAGRWG